MAGLYIHIPFCKTNCSYCDFYKTTNINLKNDFIIALKKEINLRRGFFENCTVETLYFGGGTPSVLSLDDFRVILDDLHSVFDLSSVVEFTVELNPDDVSPDYMIGLKQLGVNRVSYGIQSFDDLFLKLVRRRHNSTQAVAAVNFAKDAGIHNISIDLMYGLPGLNVDIWKKSIDGFLSLDVPHLSAYHLIYEEKTLITSQVRRGVLKEVDEEESNNQFLVLLDSLAKNGYEHYEISSFAKPGFYSRHNSSYWSGDSYLGLGPAAHSFDGKNRFWNVSNLKKYYSCLMDNSASFYESERLSEIDIYNEIVMLGLRTKSGIDAVKMKSKVDDKLYDYFLKLVTKKIESGEIVFNNGFYSISEESFLVSDKIMSDLFFVL
jgi:oxygen-independent coproporphyrinogen-3 oxidase